MVDEEGYLTEVAGCPPDALSKGGQNWGNPLYNWDNLEHTDFSWWKERMRINTKLYDVIRLNHFVGIVKDYCVPAGDEDGTNGKWRKAPGKKLADAICEAGMVWIHTRPGPVTRVLKKPSPPKSLFFNPATLTISIFTETSIAARYPVSI